MNRIPIILMLCLAIMLNGCIFKDLKEELVEFDQSYVIAGKISNQEQATGPVLVILYSHSEEQKTVQQIVFSEATGDFSFLVNPGSYSLAAFADTNSNMAWDMGELAGRYGAPDEIAIPPQRRRRLCRRIGMSSGWRWFSNHLWRSIRLAVAGRHQPLRRQIPGSPGHDRHARRFHFRPGERLFRVLETGHLLERTEFWDLFSGAFRPRKNPGPVCPWRGGNTRGVFTDGRGDGSRSVSAMVLLLSLRCSADVRRRRAERNNGHASQGLRF